MKFHILKIILISLLIIFLVGMIVYFMMFSYRNDVTTDSNQSSGLFCNDQSITNKTYIKHDPTCVINFLCIKGERAFKDECGCGCIRDS